MNDKWTDRLSEYLDGELDDEQRTALQAHLATCGDCRATLEDLRRVVARAKALADRAPAGDLWSGIARQIRREHVPDVRDRLVHRRFSLTVGQLLAASIALALVSGSAAWVALRPGPTVNPTMATARPGTPITPVSWTSRTDLAVADLQEALTRNESRLDTATVRVVRQNLALIDRAIAEARAALESDPGSTYLNLHLANTMRRKVELLRRVNALVSES